MPHPVSPAPKKRSKRSWWSATGLSCRSSGSGRCEGDGDIYLRRQPVLAETSLTRTSLPGW